MIKNSVALLVEPFRSNARALLAELMSQRIYVVVLETLRDMERQKKLFDMGRSKTLNSKHLTGRAIDLAPVGEYVNGLVRVVDWEDIETWKKVDAIASEYNISWGGNWRTFKDSPHFEEAES